MFTCMVRCGGASSLLNRLLQHLTQLLSISSTPDLQQSSDELSVSAFHVLKLKKKLISLFSLCFLAPVNFFGYNGLHIEVGRKQFPLLAARARKLFQMDFSNLLAVLSFSQSVLMHQLKKYGALLFMKRTLCIMMYLSTTLYTQLQRIHFVRPRPCRSKVKPWPLIWMLYNSSNSACLSPRLYLCHFFHLLPLMKAFSLIAAMPFDLENCGPLYSFSSSLKAILMLTTSEEARQFGGGGGGGGESCSTKKLQLLSV